MRGSISFLWVSMLALVPLVANSPMQSTARQALDRKLSQYSGATGGSEIIEVTHPSLAAALPRHTVFVLRFNRFPVAGVPQPPLAANNVFVVTPDQAVHLITNSGGLQKFFHDALRLVETPDQAVTAGTAWLRLLQELHQDGFFRFNEPNVPPPLTTRDVPPSNIRVIGTLTVLPDDGDSGQISTTLYFNRGRLAVAEVSIDLKSGIRPVCQLTDTFPRSSGTSAHPSSADSVTLFAKSFGSPMASPCRWPSAAGTKTSSWRRPSN